MKNLKKINILCLILVGLLVFGLNNKSFALGIDSLSEQKGPVSGGNSIIISGSGFVLNEKQKVQKYCNLAGSILLLTDKNQVMSAGDNRYGQLGDGTQINRANLVDITSKFAGEKIIDVFCDTYSSAAVSESGKLFTWGYNYYGQLGDGSTDISMVPQDISLKINNEKVKKLSFSSNPIVITEDDNIYSWGSNFAGQVGNGNTTNQTSPVNITSIFNGDRPKEIATSGSHSIALTESDKVLTWGNNYRGKLGNNSTTNSLVPIDITNNFAGQTISKVYNGSDNSGAISESGELFTWGDGRNGKIGDGTTNDSYLPKNITYQFGGEKITDFDIFISNAGTITESGKIFTWGLNNFGQLGDGSLNSSSNPVEITQNFPNNLNQISFEVGSSQMSLLNSNGMLYVWGNNSPVSQTTLPVNANELLDLPLAEYDQVKTVYFGENEVVSFEIIDENNLRVLVPAHNPGVVDVKITDIYGDEFMLRKSYEYVADSVNPPEIIPEEDIQAPNTGV